MKRSAQLAEGRLPGGVRRNHRASGEHPELNETSLKHYWDLRSKDYIEDTGIGPAVYRDIAEYLTREGVFMAGDTVLDVGCGPGTFSLLFAECAKAVFGLDVSDGMLSAMMSKAKASGTGNIRPICSSWEKYDSKKKFDLVFSSFCPAVNDAETLLKMEERSRRSCCCVTSACAGQFPPVNRLQELLAGEHLKYDPSDTLYLFNILYYSDRAPSLRTFKHDITICVPTDKLVNYFIAYFGMFMDMDRNKKNVVSDHIDSVSKDGVYRLSSHDTISVVHWDV